MANISFRNSKIVYYGPHGCERCGALICRMGFEWGGNAFTYPEGLIYPNTEWHVHVCDPKRPLKVQTLPEGVEADKEWARNQPHGVA